MKNTTFTIRCLLSTFLFILRTLTCNLQQIHFLSGRTINILLLLLYLCVSCQNSPPIPLTVPTSSHPLIADSIAIKEQYAYKPIEFVIDRGGDTLRADTLTLKNGCVIYFSPCQQQGKNYYCVTVAKNGAEYLQWCYHEFTSQSGLEWFYDIVDFEDSFAITDKIGQTLHLYLYDKGDFKCLVDDARRHVIDTTHQIVIYDDYSEDNWVTLYDLQKRKKTNIEKAFAKCKDPYWGAQGSYQDIKVYKMTNEKIYLRYQNCRAIINR